MFRVSALVLAVFLFGCAPLVEDSGPAGGGADGSDGSDGDGGDAVAYVAGVSADYATGTLSTVTIEGRAVRDDLVPIASDAAVAMSGGALWQLNRYGFDTLRKYTPGELSAPAWEVELGDLSNPADAEVCDGRLFVSLYGTERLAILDPDTGLVEGAVDLSSHNDGDGVGPEPGGMVQHDGRLYVSLDRLDRTDGAWSDAGGRVVEVDCARGVVTDAWSVGGNTHLLGVWGDRVVASGRAFGDQPAGVYALTPGEEAALVADLTATGHDPTGGAIWSEVAVVVTVAPDYSGYALRCVELASGAVTTATTTQAFLTSVSTHPGGEAWVTMGWSWLDPEGAPPGIQVYDVADCAPAGDPIQLSLAPTSLAFE